MNLSTWLRIVQRLCFVRRPLAGARRPGRNVRRCRPHVEPLEERTLLATRLVVPLGQPADNVTPFPNLATAIGVGTTVNGDVIQVEPGSVPGGATVNKVLTLQGDPHSGPPSLPQVGPLTLAVAGVILQNLNLSD